MPIFISFYSLFRLTLHGFEIIIYFIHNIIAVFAISLINIVSYIEVRD